MPVFDADAAVHALYAPGGGGAAVDRDALSRSGDGRRRRPRAAGADRRARIRPRFGALEALVHPLVRKAEERFLDAARARNEDVVILDIPLLFETGRSKTMDAIVVVSAPEAVQRERVLKRPGMTPEKFEAIRARQVPDVEKRAQSRFRD